MIFSTLQVEDEQADKKDFQASEKEEQPEHVKVEALQEVKRRAMPVDPEEKVEICNQIEETKPTRLEKRNWSLGYIIRVYDWCLERKKKSKIGRRALARLASEF